MIDITVKDLKKAFEVKKNILDGLSFQVQHGERVGILGKNGAGKTTLFRILVGEISEDTGTVSIGGGARLGLISQIPRYPAGTTVEDVLRSAHRRLERMQERMQELAARMDENSDRRLLEEYDRLQARFENLGGYSTEVELNRVANGLDIPASMRSQLFDSLSGGEKTRVNLARLILEDTDILLLDEPTNHLDMHATEWLEDYLLRFKGTVLTISHDRWFLDKVVTRTIEIVHGRAEVYNGNYSFYMEEKQRRYEEQMKLYEKNQKEIAHLQEAADKLHLWAFMGNDKLHKRAFSMEKRIAKLSQAERPEKARQMKARFKERAFVGDEVLVLDGVGKCFGERRLYGDVELLMEGGERIALIGDNGTGKSTLLKCIVGEEELSEGRLWTGPSVRTAYLPQLVKFENPNRDLVDTMLYEAKCTPQEARDRLAAFGFMGEDVFKTVGCLSGGEQSRLRLCILMKDDINLLVLDEPFVGLDPKAAFTLKGIMRDVTAAGGAIFFSTHVLEVAEKLCDKIAIIKDGKLIKSGTMEDVKGDESLEEVFLELEADDA